MGGIVSQGTRHALHGIIIKPFMRCIQGRSVIPASCNGPLGWGGRRHGMGGVSEWRSCVRLSSQLQSVQLVLRAQMGRQRALRADPCSPAMPRKCHCVCGGGLSYGIPCKEPTEAGGICALCGCSGGTLRQVTESFIFHWFYKVLFKFSLGVFGNQGLPLVL